MDSVSGAGVNLDLIARSDNIRLLIKRSLRTSNTKPTLFRLPQNVTMVESGRKGKMFIGSIKLDRLVDEVIQFYANAASPQGVQDHQGN